MQRSKQLNKQPINLAAAEARAAQADAQPSASASPENMYVKHPSPIKRGESNTKKIENPPRSSRFKISSLQLLGEWRSSS
jgi:hypothetical protein